MVCTKQNCYSLSSDPAGLQELPVTLHFRASLGVPLKMDMINTRFWAFDTGVAEAHASDQSAFC